MFGYSIRLTKQDKKNAAPRFVHPKRFTLSFGTEDSELHFQSEPHSQSRLLDSGHYNDKSRLFGGKKVRTTRILRNSTLPPIGQLWLLVKSSFTEIFF